MKFKQYIKENYQDEARDITQHGCSGGFHGLIYYTETVALHDEHEDEIWEWLYETAESFGQNILELIASFGGSKDVGSLTQQKNLLVWAFVESVCREMVEGVES